MGRDMGTGWAGGTCTNLSPMLRMLMWLEGKLACGLKLTTKMCKIRKYGQELQLLMKDFGIVTLMVRSKY